MKNDLFGERFHVRQGLWNLHQLIHGLLLHVPEVDVQDLHLKQTIAVTIKVFSDTCPSTGLLHQVSNTDNSTEGKKHERVHDLCVCSLAPLRDFNNVKLTFQMKAASLKGSSMEGTPAPLINPYMGYLKYAILQIQKICESHN